MNISKIIVGLVASAFIGSAFAKMDRADVGRDGAVGDRDHNGKIYVAKKIKDENRGKVAKAKAIKEKMDR